MAEVALAIGGRSYKIVCRDGGEAHLIGLATRVDAKVEEARAVVGTPSEVRQLLFAALLLADEASEAAAAHAVPVAPSGDEANDRSADQAGSPSGDQTDDPATIEALTTIAARLELLANALEQGADTP